MKATDRLRERLYPIGKGRYLIGLSGGADSVALLLMLLPEVRRGKIRLEAIHVNHGLRGEASEEDARFAENLCRRENIPFHLRLSYHACRELSRKTQPKIEPVLESGFGNFVRFFLSFPS